MFLYTSSSIIIGSFYDQNPNLRKNDNVPNQGQDQGQGQGQDHLLLQRAALPPFLVLTLTLALVRNIIMFSKVRVLVLNQPISLGEKKSTKRYPQSGANAPMVGANVPTEPQNSEKTK